MTFPAIDALRAEQRVLTALTLDGRPVLGHHHVADPALDQILNVLDLF